MSGRSSSSETRRNYLTAFVSPETNLDCVLRGEEKWRKGMNRRGRSSFPRRKEQKPQTVRFYEEGEHFAERKTGRREKTSADDGGGERGPR